MRFPDAICGTRILSRSCRSRVQRPRDNWDRVPGNQQPFCAAAGQEARAGHAVPVRTAGLAMGPFKKPKVALISKVPSWRSDVSGTSAGCPGSHRLPFRSQFSGLRLA